MWQPADNQSEEGYAFNGWSTAPSGGNLVSPTSAVSVPSDHGLYAQWATDTYSVNFSATQATSGVVPGPGVKTHDIAYTIPSTGSLARAGHVLDGWRIDGDERHPRPDSWRCIRVGNHDVVFIAVWSALSYPGGYDANSATSGLPPDNQTKTHGIPLVIHDNGGLARVGHTFAGWNASADGDGTAYLAGSEYTQDQPLVLCAVGSRHLSRSHV